MANPVSWDVAQRVATWVGSGRGPFGNAPPQIDEATRRQLEVDFADATRRAEELVIAATGLRPASGPARGSVVDRPDWVAGNITSFRQLLEPMLNRLDRPNLPPALAGVAGNVTGAQLGVVLGWMSTRVLGQYDVLLGEGDIGDIVSYVGPNVVAMERRYGFPPDQFRLWIALHEVTHRCQFTGVPWLHEHFLGLVNEGLAGVSPDPKRFADALRRAVAAARAGQNPLEDAGILGLVAPPEQLAVLRRIQALMSLLEGHGDITMDRAGAGAVAEANWFSRTLRERRRKASPAARILQQLTGLEAKMRQYQEGERFIEAVEAAGGEALFARVWEKPEHLPTLDEIRQPDTWVARMSTATVAT